MSRSKARSSEFLKDRLGGGTQDIPLSLLPPDGKLAS